MATRSRCMSGNTGGCRISWRYRWTVMVPRINTKVQFPHARQHSTRRRRWVDVKGSRRNGRRDPKCPLARSFRMVREDRGAPNEGLPVPGRGPKLQLYF
ncbi:uncharacterized protein TNCV_432291 [Trichonephila clavipes]|nr:uncharacterized protein TNCV_432291 [Trichonephila clavipes]